MSRSWKCTGVVEEEKDRTQRVHVRFVTKDSTQRRNDGVLGGSAWLSAKPVGREELKQVCEINWYDLVSE
ncbi:hypothetical protein NBRC10513_007301 [Rhodotorula toruloides]